MNGNRWRCPIWTGTEEDLLYAVIRRARLLLQRGWCRHRMAAMDPEGNVPASVYGGGTHFCLSGALTRALYDLAPAKLHRFTAITIHVAEHLVPRAPGIHPSGGLTIFNDLEARSVDDVLALLDRAGAKREVDAE